MHKVMNVHVERNQCAGYRSYCVRRRNLFLPTGQLGLQLRHRQSHLLLIETDLMSELLLGLSQLVNLGVGAIECGAVLFQLSAALRLSQAPVLPKSLVRAGS